MLSVTVFFLNILWLCLIYQGLWALTFDFVFSIWKLAFFWSTQHDTSWVDRESGVGRQLLEEVPAGPLSTLHCRCPWAALAVPEGQSLSQGKGAWLGRVQVAVLVPGIGPGTLCVLKTPPLPSVSEDGLTALIARTLCRCWVAVCIDVGDSHRVLKLWLWI